MKCLTTSSKGGEAKAPPIRSLQSFIIGMGISPVTAWRFQKRGWIETINIAGRRYITSEAEQRFISRAAAGEFAQEHKTPMRKAA
jgi:hypothetical protein